MGGSQGLEALEWLVSASGISLRWERHQLPPGAQAEGPTAMA